MAEKVFETTTQGHNCSKELSELPAVGPAFERNSSGDIALCSCGKYFVWIVVQWDAYWTEVSPQEAIANVLNANTMLTENEARTILKLQEE